jgi:hypothetical protein
VAPGMSRKPRRLDHRPLLENGLVRSWYDENRLRSARTADVNLRQLGLCLSEVGLTPRSLLDLARSDPGRLRGRLVDYATWLQKRGRLGSYIAKTFTGVGSFLRHHEVDFRGFPRVNIVRGQSIENERVPTQEELSRLLRALPIRGQVSALLMAHSGLRPGVFSVYRAGDEALRLRDLPELDVPGMRFRTIPFTVRVPGSLSKNRRAYVTFGSGELADALLVYLRERTMRPRWKAGRDVPPEVLSGDSPVVAVRDTETETGFVTVKAVTAEIRNAIRKVVPAETAWRPYVLRAYASTQLLLSETRGLITRDMREAILGHDLGVSGRYNLSKKLHPSMVDEMRAAYGRCAPFLASGSARGGTNATNPETRKLLLLAVGYTEEQVARMNVPTMESDALVDAIQKSPSRSGAGASPQQQVVDESALPQYLADGWRFVSTVNGSKAVVERLNRNPR